MATGAVTVAGYTLPPGATDAHSHVIGPVGRYPFAPGRSYTPTEAHLDAYREMIAGLGLRRSVIVQPSFYGTDNSCTLDAVAALGVERARAVVMARDLSEDRLEDLHRRGARGVRFITMVHGGQSIDALRRLADEVAPLGWHIQMWAAPATWRGLADTLVDLPVPVVIDHLAQIVPADPGSEDDTRALLDLLDSGRVHTKLCCYRSSRQGPPYEDVRPLVERLVEHRPDRLVWGVDWPHTMIDQVPDDHLLERILVEWVGDHHVLDQVLVDTPGELYGFGPVHG
ncbi:MAG: amidohydrolase family protein [Pauljensenia sp.]